MGNSGFTAKGREKETMQGRDYRSYREGGIGLRCDSWSTCVGIELEHMKGFDNEAQTPQWPFLEAHRWEGPEDISSQSCHSYHLVLWNSRQ